VAIAVRLLGPADVGLAGPLAALVNEVYALAEAGLWNGGQRTSPAEIGELIRAGEIALAADDGAIVGCIRVRDLDDEHGEFGILASAPDRRGAGIGTALVTFAEGIARDHGRRAMRLELLMPREWRHASKMFLDAWYGRMGYRPIERRSVHEAHPELAPELATACDFVTYEKPL
jgi:GNAT superfamily N-acetyltransferase